jgi:TDG/mug DNA glycosylase family protein
MMRTLRDILARDLPFVFCGINPGMTAAVSGHHFSSPSNRFWKVIHLAGFTPHQIRPQNDRTLLKFGCGLTTVVARATRRADELAAEEFEYAVIDLEHKIVKYRPHAVIFLGKAAFSAIARIPAVEWGAQAQPFGGASVWVMPNPSGLNRGYQVRELVRLYRKPFRARSHRLHQAAGVRHSTCDRR